MPAQAAVGWSPAPRCPAPHTGHGARGAEHGKGRRVPVSATSQRIPALCTALVAGERAGETTEGAVMVLIFPKDKGG